MGSLVLRFSLTEDTGSFDALATALRRESAATIVYLNEEAIVEVTPEGPRATESAITMLVKGEDAAVDIAMTWLDRLVVSSNIDFIDPAVAAETLFQNGLELRRLGDNEGALGWFDRILAVDDSLGRVWTNRANTLTDLERWDEAHESYERAIACDPANATAHFNFATLLTRHGDLAAAQAELREAVRLAPQLEPARQALEKLIQFLATS